MADLLCWLQNWYSGQCDGNWEHDCGVKIETIDNPGWSVSINLTDTPLQDKEFADMTIDKGDNDWIVCKVQDGKFTGVGDSFKLDRIIEVFRAWTESRLPKNNI